MKHYIKSLLCLALFIPAMFSCNDDYEESKPISYPDNFSLGIYKNDYVKTGGISFTINLTLNEAGDTVCDVTQLDSRGVANVFSQGKVSYDKQTGIIKATFEESPLESAACLVLALKNDLSAYTAAIYPMKADGSIGEAKNSFYYFTTAPAENISYLGDWKLSDGSILTLNADSTASYAADSESAGEEGTFTADGANVKVTLANGKEITLATDAEGRTFSNGTTAFATHIMTQPKNDWIEYALGTYTSAFFGALSDRLMEYSPSRGVARINDWIMDGTQFSFYWEEGSSTCTPAADYFNTGYEYVEDNESYGNVYVYPAALDDAGNKGTYADGTFTFGVQFMLPESGYGFNGTYSDTYTVTEWLTE